MHIHRQWWSHSWANLCKVTLIQSKATVNGRSRYDGDPAFPDYQQNLGSNPLHFAARRGLKEVCEALINYVADPNAQNDAGTTPLMQAVSFGRLDIIDLLLESRASCVARDTDGFNACDLALLEGRPEVVRLLGEHYTQEHDDWDDQLEELTKTQNDNPDQLDRLGDHVLRHF